MSKLAILDIGTNSIHLVLAEVGPDFSYKILDRFKDMTRIGDGAFKTRRLSEIARARGLEVVRTLVTLARNKGYTRIKAVATSAVREAVNGGEFLETITQQTGVRVRVVTGQEEARLIYLGVRHSMEFSERPALIVDIGGGSVELILANDKKMIQGQSLKLGAIRLKDLCLRRTPPTKAMLQGLQCAIDDQLSAALKRLKDKPTERLIGTSGMIGNLTEIIYFRRTGQPVPQLNLASVTLKEVQEVEDVLKRANVKARLDIPGLDPDRSDTLLPAAMVLRTLMEQAEHDTLTISDKAIREGMIYDFIERHQERIRAEQEIPNVRRRNVVYLARRCHYPEGHSQHVAKLATQLFDQTKSVHHLGESQREWLEYAALLHDIGYVINPRQHHKHAYYLIKNSDLDGFTADEIEMIANVARYHRRALPEVKHDGYQALSVGKRKIVMVLSALLRLADALDRTHFTVIQSLAVKLGRSIKLVLYVTGDAEFEVWAAKGRADLFVQTFKVPVRFIVRPFVGEAS